MKSLASVNIVLLDENCGPHAGSSGSAGFDLKARHAVEIYPLSWEIIDTGIQVEIPSGYVGLVCPRSGLAAKHGISVTNAPGVIDSDFRGEVKVILHNHGRTCYIADKYDRIAQLVIVPYLQAYISIVDKITETDRGSGGLGSTGT